MFHRMRIYTVHIRPDEPLTKQTPVFVREGFNLWAFIFTGLWALYQRLWALMLTIVAFNMVLAFLLKGHILSPTGIGAFELGFHFIVGFHANDWVRTRLGKHGYILADVTAGDSLLRAEQRYFERTLASA